MNFTDAQVLSIVTIKEELFNVITDYIQGPEDAMERIEQSFTSSVYKSQTMLYEGILHNKRY